MNRFQLESLIAEHYGTEAEYPWAEHPSYGVFRHLENRKWFAVIMTIPYSKLYSSRTGRAEVVNLKCNPKDALMLHAHPCIFPAYHMHKGHWISVVLDDRMEEGTLSKLLEQSFLLTK
jgi:predicted DNA-binding protein (MmcQ/YjbR family)